MRTVAECNTPFEAELVKGNLENGGFHAVVFNKSMNSIYPLTMTDEQQIVEVRVPDEEFVAASQWLQNERQAEATLAEEEEEEEAEEKEGAR